MNEDKDIRIDRVRELVSKKGDSIWPGGSENTANILGEHRQLSDPLSDEDARGRMAPMSRRGFLMGGVAAAIGVFGWRWMNQETKDSLLKGAFRINERVSQAVYSPGQLAREFRPDEVT